MRQWSIGGEYDRPIARRLAEEAGVPRHLFGQTKLATVVDVMPPYLPHGKVLKTEFFRFVRRRRGRVGLLWLIMLPKINRAIQQVQRIGGRLPQWIRESRVGKKILPIRMFGSRSNAVLYAYCVNKTAQLYWEIATEHCTGPGAKPDHDSTAAHGRNLASGRAKGRSVRL
jgi:hypothetical protein